MALALTITQMGCQAPPPTSRITVASAGRISSLDPAQASTLSATQLISALGDPLYRLKRDGSLDPRLAASAPVLSDGGPALPSIVSHVMAPRFGSGRPVASR